MSDSINTDIERNVEENSTEQGKFMRCPCCGKLTLPIPANPGQQLTDHWLSCMVTGTPFTHTYPVYNGKLNITVTMLTPEAASAIDTLTTVLNILKDKNWGEEGFPVDFNQMLGISRVLISISAINISAGTQRTYTPMKSVMEISDKLNSIRLLILDDARKDEWLPEIKSIYTSLVSPELTSAVPMRMLMTVVETHNRLADIMMEAGFDSNFWSGIELA